VWGTCILDVLLSDPVGLSEERRPRVLQPSKLTVPETLAREDLHAPAIVAGMLVHVEKDRVDVCM
jgi:hypothetical protein